LKGSGNLLLFQRPPHHFTVISEANVVGQKKAGHAPIVTQNGNTCGCIEVNGRSRKALIRFDRGGLEAGAVKKVLSLEKLGKRGIGMGGVRLPSVLDQIDRQEAKKDVLRVDDRKEWVTRAKEPRKNLRNRLLLMHELIVGDHRFANGNRREHAS